MEYRKTYHLSEYERALIVDALDVAYDGDYPADGTEELMKIGNLKLLFAEAVPAEEPTPLWRTDLFTDADRESLMVLVMEEISDCIKDVAQEQLDNEPLIELVSYLDDDPEVTAECLKAIAEGHADMSDYESGEHAQHELAARTIRRFGFAEQAPENCWNVTDLGREYMDRNT